MNALGQHVAVSPAYVVSRMRMSDRALLPHEIAPTRSVTAVSMVLKILREMERKGAVRFNPQTDRWLLVVR